MIIVLSNSNFALQNTICSIYKLTMVRAYLVHVLLSRVMEIAENDMPVVVPICFGVESIVHKRQQHDLQLLKIWRVFALRLYTPDACVFQRRFHDSWHNL
jgi:uncharacterized membrane protein YhaH (DUF805 family)